MILREIKTKINSTKRISQVAKALELVSATKMKKAQRIALSSRPFAQKVVAILNRLTKSQRKYLLKKSFYFQENNSEKILAVVVSSDKGFCGSFNQNILRFAEKEIKEIEKEAEVDIMAIGKKAINYFKRKNHQVSVEFIGIGDYGKFDEVKPIADLFLRYFNEARYRKIYLFYTDFVSSFSQKPTKIQVLPLSSEEFEKILEKTTLAGVREKEAIEEEKAEKTPDYIYENSAEMVFNGLVPLLVEFEIYQAILEANASEHSARMMAMKNASQNAKDVINDLTLEYNKARQDQITSEISEISSAKEAVQ